VFPRIKEQAVTSTQTASGRSFVFGCGSLAMTDVDGAFALLDTYREAGGRTLDTARVYGTSENVVGEWLSARNAHAEMTVITKGAHPAPDWSARLSHDAIMHDLATSLAALGVFEVGGYLLHRDDPKRDVTGIAQTLAEIVRLGYAKRVGVSNWPVDRVLALEDALAAEGGPALAIVSNYGGLAIPTAQGEWPGTRSTSEELLRLAADRGFDVLGWGALSSGFFSSNGESHPEFAGGENQRRRTALNSIAADAGVPPIELLARTVAIMHPHLTPVFSTRSPERLRQVCRASIDSRLDGAVSRLMLTIREGEFIAPAW
jgi:aryl-alcohol dehydrogenase-like predicted oxidoreductase